MEQITRSSAHVPFRGLHRVFDIGQVNRLDVAAHDRQKSLNNISALRPLPKRTVTVKKLLHDFRSAALTPNAPVGAV